MSAEQKRLLAGCLAAYLLAYTGRLNLSAALPAISETLVLSATQAGLFQTVFAVVYATGQFVNGMVADRVSPRGYMAAGLLGSAACNLGIALAGSYGALLALWALNGAFQSMLWTPIMRLLARDFEGEQLPRACSVMVFAPIVGNLLAWALAGLAVNALTWEWAFAMPAALMAAASLAALKLVPGGGTGSRQPGEHKGFLDAGTLFWRSGFIGVLVCCVAVGFVRDGVIVWTPTILQQQAGGRSVLAQLLVPAINLVSVALGGLLMRRYGARPRAIVTLMMLAVAGMCALLSDLFAAGALALSLMLGFCCMLIYALNPTLVSLVPMQYAGVGRVGLTAGLIDSCIYVGSGLAGALGGALRGALGEQALFIAWVAFALAGAGAMLWAHRRLPGQWRQEG